MEMGTLDASDLIEKMNTYLESLTNDYMQSQEMSKVASLYSQGEVYIWYKRWYNKSSIIKSWSWTQGAFHVKDNISWWKEMQKSE